MSFFIYFLLYYFISCSEKDINEKIYNYTINNEEPKRKLENDEYIEINILFDIREIIKQYNYLSQSSMFEETVKEIYAVKNFFETFNNPFKKLIKIKKRNKSKIKISNEALQVLKSKGDSFNDSLLKEEFDNDLVIFVGLSESGKNTFDDLGIIQYDDNRPTVGFIIYHIPFGKNINDENQKNQLLNIFFLHETTHILGFEKTILESKGLLQTLEIERVKTYKKNVIKNNKIKELIKKYFNCNEIDYIELDGSSDEEKKFVHWEGRILLGDYMTSEIYYPEQVISEFTIAVLESLEWYKVNNYTGGLMKFGKNKGCDFLKKDCAEYINYMLIPKFNNEFCNSNSFGTCSNGRQSKGYCFITESDTEIDTNRYGRNNWIIYGLNMAEFCPVSLETSNIYVEQYYKGSCSIGTSDFGNQLKINYQTYNKFSSYFEEKIGNTSFCAFSSIINKENKSNVGPYLKVIRPTCYSMSCSDKSLTIQINTEYMVCPKKGGIISIGGRDTNYTDYEGYLFCPDYNSICTGKKFCNNIFDCIENESEPKDSIYDYSDYEKPIFYDDVRTDNNKEDGIKSNDIVIGFELSENGKCPIDCIQCRDYKQCILCKNLTGYIPGAYYVGTKENDTKPIICSSSIPEKAYLRVIDGHHHYFECIDNCSQCSDGISCDICLPTHKLNNSKTECIERIEHCNLYNESYNYTDNDTNGGGIGYIECRNCDVGNHYFCVNMNKNVCQYIENYTDKTYYKMEDENNEFSCIQKCNETYPHCKECSKKTCIICEPEYFVNKSTGHCQERVPHCSKYNDSYIVKDKDNNGGGDSYPECENCNNTGNFFCINMTKTSCDFIDPEIIEYYYDEESREYSCKKRCNETFPYCLKCNQSNCSKCIVEFSKKGDCYPTIDNCIDYKINKNDNDDYADCEQCNETGNYYCINNNRSICQEVSNNDSYFRLNDEPNSCIQKCDEVFKECIRCTKDECLNCSENYILSNINKSVCLPMITPASDDSCKALINDYNKDINNIELEDFIEYFFANSLQYPKHVHHFVGNNYTVTLFIYSQCTEDLLNQGYFKINSNELYNIVISKVGIDSNELLFSIFVTYNFQNYLTFFDIYTRHINIAEACEDCLDIPYTITNKYRNKISLVLGPAFANLVESEKLDVFSDKSEIFTDFCHNVTLKRVDIPYSERLKLLYLHDYSSQIACTGIDCKILEINAEESISICQCKIGNTFEEIKSPILEFKNYQDANSDDKISITDTFGIIKCMKSGFNNKNIFANGGFFMTAIVILAEVVFYLWYCIYFKVINLGKSKVANPPKIKNRLFLINEWQQNKANKIVIEQGDDEQKLIQSRDEEEDGNLLEEDVTFSNNLNNSSFSIDTELAIFNSNNLKKKNKDKKGRKVLVLLPEKRNKKKHKLDDEELKNISENEYLTVEQAKLHDKRSFCQIYWAVLSIKQHIINFFSDINCCKITESYVPLPIKLIRSVFMIILAFLVNILFLTQNYFLKKYKYFNQNYKILANKNDEFVVTPEEINEESIPTGKLISYAISNGFLYAIIDFVILLVAQFLLGIIFFALRNKVLEIVQKKDVYKIEELVSKTRIKYIIFFILTLCLLVIFLLTFVGFGGAYGGGFIDYLIPGIIALLILEIFPFLWSLIIALFRYSANKNGSKCSFEFSQFFMF